MNQSFCKFILTKYGCMLLKARIQGLNESFRENLGSRYRGFQEGRMAREGLDGNSGEGCPGKEL